LGFLLHADEIDPQIGFTKSNSLSRLTLVIRTFGNRTEIKTMMGIVMKKVSLSVAALVAIGLSTGAASAADMGAKVYKKAPVVAAYDPWDIAFGAAIMSDYVFRGVTQSNHNPSVTAYFEPRYNINKDLQLYVGTSFESISFPNRAAAEVDVYAGIRPTFGAFAFDFGVWGYLYPGGSCFGNVGNVPGAGFCGADFNFGPASGAVAPRSCSSAFCISFSASSMRCRASSVAPG